MTTLLKTALAAFTLASPLFAGRSSEPKEPVFIDNGKVKLGVDLARGGSIFHFSKVAPEVNLLNHYDEGRFIQQSYYGNTDGSVWAGQPWKWNPIQGGGYLGEKAKVLDYKKDGATLYVKSLPKHWATGKDVTEAVMEEWIRLEDDTAYVRFRFTYDGEVEHARRHQELPAVFVDYDLGTLAYYDGKAPWTQGDLTTRIPGWPNESVKVTEPWAAFIDKAGWGIGVCFPGRDTLTTYRYVGDGKTGPSGSNCSYFAPVAYMVVKPGFVFEYEIAVTIGHVGQIREIFARWLARNPHLMAGANVEEPK